MNFADIWTIRPTPNQGAVIAGEGWRITVLTDRLLRLEYEPENRYQSIYELRREVAEIKLRKGLFGRWV